MSHILVPKGEFDKVRSAASRQNDVFKDLYRMAPQVAEDFVAAAKESYDLALKQLKEFGHDRAPYEMSVSHFTPGE